MIDIDILGITVNYVPEYTMSDADILGVTISVNSLPFTKTKLIISERITNKITDCSKITIHGVDGDKVLQKTSGGASLLTAITQKPDGSLEATLSPAVTYVTDGAVEATAILTILRDGKTEQKTVRVEIL